MSGWASATDAESESTEDQTFDRRSSSKHKKARVSFTTVQTRTFNEGSVGGKTLNSPVAERDLSPYPEVPHLPGYSSAEDYRQNYSTMRTGSEISESNRVERHLVTDASMDMSCPVSADPEVTGISELIRRDEMDEQHASPSGGHSPESGFCHDLYDEFKAKDENPELWRSRTSLKHGTSRVAKPKHFLAPSSATSPPQERMKEQRMRSHSGTGSPTIHMDVLTRFGKGGESDPWHEDESELGEPDGAWSDDGSGVCKVAEGRKSFAHQVPFQYKPGDMQPDRERMIGQQQPRREQLPTEGLLPNDAFRSAAPSARLFPPVEPIAAREDVAANPEHVDFEGVNKQFEERQKRRAAQDPLMSGSVAASWAAAAAEVSQQRLRTLDGPYAYDQPGSIPPLTTYPEAFAHRAPWPRQPPAATSSGGNVPPSSPLRFAGAGEEENVCTSDQGASLRYSDMSGSMELPAESVLKEMIHMQPGTSPHRARGAARLATERLGNFNGTTMPRGTLHVPWDEFLRRCGIHFHMQEAPSAPAMNGGACTTASGELATAAAAQKCPLIKGIADFTWQRRAKCLQQAVEKLHQRNAETKHETQSFIQQWNRLPNAPQAACELEEVRGRPEEERGFKSRMEGLRVYCKSEAWKSWYQAKRGWLQKDLAHLQQHTATLRRYENHLVENRRRLENDLRDVRRATERCQGFQQHLHGEQRYQELHASLSNRATSARVDAERKVATLQALSDAEAVRISNLEALVEEARSNAKRAKEAAKKKQSEHLRMKLQRLSIEKARYSQAGHIVEATPAYVYVALRAGARLRIAQETHGWSRKPSNPVRVTLEIDKDTNNPKRDELVRCMWLACTAQIRGRVDTREAASPCMVVVAYERLPLFLNRLGLASIHVADQLEVLDELPRKIPGVLDTDVKLAPTTNAATSSPTVALLIVMEILVSNTHEVDSNGCLVTVDPGHDFSAFQGARCILQVTADPVMFPEDESWRNPRLHMISGSASQHGNHATTIADFNTQAAMELEATPLSRNFIEAVPAMVEVARLTLRRLHAAPSM